MRTVPVAGSRWITERARRRPIRLATTTTISVTDDDPHPATAAQLLRTIALIVLGAAGLALVALVGLGILIGSNFRECLASRWIEGSTATWSTATLDSAHPVAQQTVTVRIPALALPDDVVADRILLNIDPEIVAVPARSSVPATERPSARPVPDAGIIDVAFIALDATTPGRIVPAMDEPALEELPYLRSAPLHCVKGEACERSYTVIVSLTGGSVIGPVDLRWRPVVRISADSFGGCPETRPPTPTVAATTPTTTGAPIVSARLPVMSASGTIVANHLRLKAPTASDVAWVRVELEIEPGLWLPWVRVIDDSGHVLADGSLGGPWGAPAETLIEVPALTHCTEGPVCAEGLWVVVQAIPSVVPPFVPSWKPVDPPAAFRWSASVSTVGRGSAAGPAPRLTIDATASDPGPIPAVQVAGPTVVLADGVARSVEARIHVPAGAADVEGDDWRRGAFAVGNWNGQGKSITATLEGPGASAIRGYASGHAGANLVAHPFDRCPEDGPCNVTLELVSLYTNDPYSSGGGPPMSTWSVSLVGVPANSAVTFGEPVDRPPAVGDRTAAGLNPAVAILVGVGILAVILVGLVRRSSWA